MIQDLHDPVRGGAESQLVHLFDAALQFTSEFPADAVVPPEGREGIYLGSGDGVATGERLRGRLRWSFYSAALALATLSVAQIEAGSGRPSPPAPRIIGLVDVVEPRVVAVGWIPAYGRSGDPAVWFYSRGC